MYALRQNINLFYTPTQIVSGSAPLNKSLRVGGMVVKNSVVRNGLTVGFQLTDFKQSVKVTYTGILPDLFREGQGVVVLGKVGGVGEIKAQEVLAKHDANYMPAEVKEALKAAQDGR